MTPVFLHSGVNAGETFHYQVFAVSGNLVSPRSNTANATTDPVVKPEKPDNLVATVGDETGADPQPASPTPLIADTDTELTISLEWSAPPDPAGAPILSYVVHYALIETPGSWTELDPEDDADFSIDGVTAEHSNLDAGRSYRYRVAAYNKTMKVDDETVYDPNFLSGWASPDVASTRKGAAPALIAHGDVRVGVTPSEEKIFLYWPAPDGPPADPMGDPVNAYLVQGRTTTKGNGLPLNADDTICADANGVVAAVSCPWQTIKDNIGRPSGTFIHSFEVTVSDVNANTDYDAYFKTTANWEYRIRAKNRSTPAGTGIAVGVQAQPANFVAVPRSTEGDGVVTETKFLLEPSTPSVRVARSQDPAHFDGRTALAVRWNKSEIAGTPAMGGDDAVDADPAEAYRIEYSNTGPSDPGGYDWRLLRVYAPSQEAAAVAEQSTTDDAAVVHQLATGQDNADEDLTAGQTRHYRIFAVPVAGSLIMTTPTDGRSGTTANPRKPEPPTALRTIPESHTSIKLRWEAPDDDGTAVPPNADDDHDDGSEEGPSVIVGYYIQYLEEGAINWAYIKNDDGGNLITDDKGKAAEMHIHDKLVPGSALEYRMAAVNKISRSEQRSNWTEIVKGSTTPIPLPNEAAGLVVEATGPSTIDMTWLAQAEQPQHAEVTEYVIEHSPDGKEGTFTVLASVAMVTDDDVHSIHVDTGLSPETERFYRVYAKNARGISDQVSNVASATTSERMNTAPTAGAAIADQTVRVDATVMVQSTITDADTDDTLTWSKMSNMPTYATAEVDDMGMVTITGVAEGMATITVTATDIADAMVTQDIMVTVEAANTAPTAGAAIADQTVMVGSTVMVQSTITDADTDDALTWSKMSNMPTYATAEVDDMGMVTITGVAEGMATITVTATDMADAMVTQDIMVTVEAANTAPTAGAAIADQTVMVGSTVMVQSTITDADTDDALTWSKMSNMPTYATAEVDDMGMVTITGVAEGMATITVTATDIADETATQEIMVTVEAADTRRTVAVLPLGVTTGPLQ